SPMGSPCRRCVKRSRYRPPKGAGSACVRSPNLREGHEPNAAIADRDRLVLTPANRLTRLGGVGVAGGGRPVSTRPTPTRFAILGVALARVVAACQSQTPQGSGGPGGTAVTGAGPQLTIAMITHAVPGDTYWDIIRAGANAAAGHLNV